MTRSAATLKTLPPAHGEHRKTGAERPTASPWDTAPNEAAQGAMGGAAGTLPLELNANRRCSSFNTMTLRWLYALKGKCPEWYAQWEQSPVRLQETAPGSVAGSNPSRADDFSLFCQQHRRLATLVDALAHAATHEKEMLQRLERVLIAHFPSDDAWRSAIHHRTGLLRARQTTRKHGAAYLPRILAERRQALVLIRGKKGTWHTRKGVPAEQGLKRGGAHRSAFLQELMRIPSLTRIEVPLAMDFTGAETVAAEVRKALASRQQMAVAARKEKRTWALALRRIQSMGLKGCFDAASQTVIVDPRHMDSMKHEICHWLLEHGVEGPRQASQTQVHEQQVHTLMQDFFASAPRKRRG